MLHKNKDVLTGVWTDEKIIPATYKRLVSCTDDNADNRSKANKVERRRLSQKLFAQLAELSMCYCGQIKNRWWGGRKPGSGKIASVTVSEKKGCCWRNKRRECFGKKKEKRKKDERVERQTTGMWGETGKSQWGKTTVCGYYCFISITEVKYSHREREREIKDRGDTGVMSNDTVCSVKKNPYSRLIYCYIDDCIVYNASIGVTIKWWPVVRIGPASHLFVPIDHRKHWCSSSSLSVLYRLLHVNQPIGC